MQYTQVYKRFMGLYYCIYLIQTVTKYSFYLPRLSAKYTENCQQID